MILISSITLSSSFQFATATPGLEGLCLPCLPFVGVNIVRLAGVFAPVRHPVRANRLCENLWGHCLVSALLHEPGKHLTHLLGSGDEGDFQICFMENALIVTAGTAHIRMF